MKGIKRLLAMKAMHSCSTDRTEGTITDQRVATTDPRGTLLDQKKDIISLTRPERVHSRHERADDNGMNFQFVPFKVQVVLERP